MNVMANVAADGTLIPRTPAEIYEAALIFTDFIWMIEYYLEEYCGGLEKYLSSENPSEVEMAREMVNTQERLLSRYQNDPLFQEYFGQDFGSLDEIDSVMKTLNWILDGPWDTRGNCWFINTNYYTVRKEWEWPRTLPEYVTSLPRMKEIQEEISLFTDFLQLCNNIKWQMGAEGSINTEIELCSSYYDSSLFLQNFGQGVFDWNCKDEGYLNYLVEKTTGIIKALRWAEGSPWGDLGF